MAKRGRRPPEWNVLNPGAFPKSSPSSYSPEDSVRRNAAAAIFITTLNVTYGGDSYNGNIHDGFVGGRRNENSDNPTSVIFSLGGATLAVGVAGVAALLMLLRR